MDEQTQITDANTMIIGSSQPLEDFFQDQETLKRKHARLFSEFVDSRVGQNLGYGESECLAYLEATKRHCISRGGNVDRDLSEKVRELYSLLFHT